MKHLPLWLLVAGGLLSLPLGVQAQISNNESWSQYLATQCAIGGGRSASDYHDYGRGLAQTLGLLTQSQQERVFGYLPNPGNAMSAPQQLDDLTGAVPTADPLLNKDDDEGPEPTTSPSPSSNLLVDLIDKVNDTLFGGEPSPEPIIGGTPPVEPDAPATQPELPATQPDLPATQPDLPATQPDLPPSEPVTGPSQAFLDAYDEWVSTLSPSVANSTKRFKEAFKAEFNEVYEDVFHDPYKVDSKEIDKEAEKLLK